MEFEEFVRRFAAAANGTEEGRHLLWDELALSGRRYLLTDKQLLLVVHMVWGSEIACRLRTRMHGEQVVSLWSR